MKLMECLTHAFLLYIKCNSVLAYLILTIVIYFSQNKYSLNLTLLIPIMHTKSSIHFRIYVLIYLLILFTSGNVFGQSAPASCTAAIGSPANGTTHYININWSAVTGATAYQLEDSTSSGWTSIYSGTATTYAHNTGGTGNVPFYYRVNATSTGTSGWTYCTQYPIYNACNDTTPLLSNATSSSITATLQTAAPYANANNATYAIYCVTTGQYVQVNGTLGASAVYQTAAAWGSIVITGLTASTNYCFYTAAQNHDGNVQTASGGSILAVQPFNTSTTLDVSSGSGTRWYSPNTCEGSSEMKWYSTGGCTGGVAGYTTSPGQYYGCFLRSPVFSAAGQSQFVLSFDLNSSQSFAGDSIYFYLWSSETNSYYPPSQPPAYSIVKSINGLNESGISLATANNCTHETVVIDLTSIPANDRTGLYVYINPIFFEFAGTAFNVLFDNIGISGGYQTACLSTTSCSTATITGNPANETVCSGSNTSFTVTATGGVASYQWQISTDGSTWTNLSNNAPYSNVTTQTLGITAASSSLNGYQYRCSVTGSCGGTPVSTAATLTVNSTPVTTGSISGSAAVCAGQSALVYSIASITGATAYNWSLPTGASITNGSGTNFITVNYSSTATSGNIIVTPSNTCGNGSASLPLGVTVNTSPAMPGGITGSQSPCSGNPNTYSVATVSGATSYIWTLPTGWTGSSSTSSISAVPSSTSGNITVSASNGCGASAPQSLIVNVGQAPAMPTSINGTTTVCGTGPFTYSVVPVTGAIYYNWNLPAGWSGNSASNSINATPGPNGGNITVSAANTCGASATQVLAVAVSQVPATPGTISGPSTVCGTSAVTYSITSIAGASSYNWTLPSGWSGSSTAASITANPGSNGGNVMISASNTCGTSSAQSVMVNVSAIPAIPGIISGPTSVCSYSTNTYAVASVTGASSYNWTLPGDWSGSSSVDSIIATSGLSSGNITVSAANICGTSLPQTLAVLVNSVSASITANGPTTFCQGDSVILTSSPGTAYLWSDGETSSSITVYTSNSYTVTVTGSGGCTAASSATIVSVNSLPNATLNTDGPVKLCQGGNVTLKATFSSVFVETYNWSNGANSQSITVDSSGTYQVTLTANGCTAVSQAVTVIVYPAPPANITASGAITFCKGGSVTLTAPANSKYTWSSGQTTQAITVAVTGNYSVTVTNANGCTATSATVPVVVSAVPAATITASGATSLCQGASVTLTANAGNGYKYAWSTNASTQAIAVSSAGSYVVTVTSSAGCTKASAAKKVTVTALPAASISTKGSICSEGTEVITEKKIGSDTYLWSTGATTNIIDVTAAGNYTVTVYGAKCSAEASVAVTCITGPEQVNDKTDNGSLAGAGVAENTGLQAEIYPNPYGTEFHLKIQSSNSDKIGIRVFDINGSLVEERPGVAYGAEILLGANYVCGVYVVQVMQGENSKQLRVLKIE